MDEMTRARREGNGAHAKYREGRIARRIEEKTARINSDIFLWAALGSMASSLTLKCLGQKHTALFVGQWAAPFLLLGLYNKLVKVAGHDQESQGMMTAAEGQAD